MLAGRIASIKDKLGFFKGQHTLAQQLNFAYEIFIACNEALLDESKELKLSSNEKVRDELIITRNNVFKFLETQLDVHPDKIHTTLQIIKEKWEKLRSAEDEKTEDEQARDQRRELAYEIVNDCDDITLSSDEDEKDRDQIRKNAMDFLKSASELNINDSPPKDKERIQILMDATQQKRIAKTAGLIKTKMEEAHNKQETNREYIPGKTLELTFLPRPEDARDTTITGDKTIRRTHIYQWRKAAELALAHSRREAMFVHEDDRESDVSENIQMLSPIMRASKRALIKDGLFVKYDFGSKGHVIYQKYDTADEEAHGKEGYAAYTINRNGEISFFPHLGKEDRVAHSTMNAGAPVIGAGEIKVTNGKPIIINDFSGHYKPTFFNIFVTLKFFDQHGIDFSHTLINIGKQIPPFLEVKEVVLTDEEKKQHDITSSKIPHVYRAQDIYKINPAKLLAYYEATTPHRVLIKNGSLVSYSDITAGNAVLAEYDTKEMNAKTKEGYAAYSINKYGEISLFNHACLTEFKAGDQISPLNLRDDPHLVSAGEMKITNGKLVEIQDASDEFKPQLTNILISLKLLTSKEVDISDTKIKLRGKLPAEFGIEIQAQQDEIYIYRAKDICLLLNNKNLEKFLPEFNFYLNMFIRPEDHQSSENRLSSGGRSSGDSTVTMTHMMEEAARASGVTAAAREPRRDPDPDLALPTDESAATIRNVPAQNVQAQPDATVKEKEGTDHRSPSVLRSRS